MKLSGDISAAVKAGIPLAVSVILFFVVGNFGISKISAIRSQIKTAQTENNTLTQKVSILETVSATSADTSGAAATALPDSNTSLAVVSQVKNLAVLNTVLLSNIKSSAETKDASGLSKVDVSFDLAGTRQQVETYLGAISGLAPVMVVNSIKMNEAGGGLLTNVVVSSFWSELPKTMPAMTEVVNDLTSDEKAVLSKVEALQPPSFSAVPPSQTGGKANPFTP